MAGAQGGGANAPIRRIKGRIKSVRVAEAPAQAPRRVEMGEHVDRPLTLAGHTRKLNTPLSRSALYVTVNHLVINEGTPHEARLPFEVFVNSKEMEHFQWVVALTRIISAVFRKGGDYKFVVEELKSVFDPRGGYLRRREYVPSLVAELGEVIGEELEWMEGRGPRREAPGAGKPDAAPGGLLRGQTLCPQCTTGLMVRQSGCDQCMSCGYSKCD